MQILLIIGAVQAFYLAVFIFLKRNKEIPNYLLVGYLFIAGLILFSEYISRKHDIFGIRIFLYNANLLHMPLFYIYVHSQIKERNSFNIKYILHFFPYIFSMVYLVYIFNKYSESSLTNIFNHTFLFHRPFLFDFFYILDLIVIPYYFFWILMLLVEHKDNIKNQFSYIEKIDFKWVQILSILVLTLWLIIAIPVFFNVRLPWLPGSENFTLSFVILIFITYYIGFFGSRQTIIDFDNITPVIKKKESADPFGRADHLSNDDERVGYKHILINYIHEQKPYLNPQLTIGDLSGFTGIPQLHLLRILNEDFKKSFYDFINEFRVKEFKEKIVKTDDIEMAVFSIARECGFSSGSSFNRIFKNSAHQKLKKFLKKNDI